jgi:predicted transposase YbfD/YdcC
VASRAVEPGELPFPHVAQVARIERRREFADGRVEQEAVYVISSRKREQLGEEALAAAQRAHWGIENGLHRRRDHAYDEDRHQVVARGTANVMASLRNLAIAVRKHREAKNRRKRDRYLPQMHRRFAAKPHLAIALLTKPWS